MSNRKIKVKKLEVTQKLAQGVNMGLGIGIAKGTLIDFSNSGQANNNIVGVKMLYLFFGVLFSC